MAVAAFILLEGDEQTGGSDRLKLEGDAQATGTDLLGLEPEPAVAALLEGDEQTTGTDRLKLDGDEQDTGTDVLLFFPEIGGEVTPEPEVTYTRTGGWLPIIYVDRNGNPVIDNEPVKAKEPPKPVKEQSENPKPRNIGAVSAALRTSVDSELIEITETLRSLESDLQERMRKRERERLEAEWREYQRQQAELIAQWRFEQQRKAQWLFMQNQSALAALLLTD